LDSNFSLSFLLGSEQLLPKNNIKMSHLTPYVIGLLQRAL